MAQFPRDRSKFLEQWTIERLRFRRLLVKILDDVPFAFVKLKGRMDGQQHKFNTKTAKYELEQKLSVTSLEKSHFALPTSQRSGLNFEYRSSQ